jgi:hypothetical protein
VAVEIGPRSGPMSLASHELEPAKLDSADSVLDSRRIDS